MRCVRLNLGRPRAGGALAVSRVAPSAAAQALTHAEQGRQAKKEAGEAGGDSTAAGPGGLGSSGSMDWNAACGAAGVDAMPAGLEALVVSTGWEVPDDIA